MTWDGIYTFDAADSELTLLPMAARRALDRTGLHLSLLAWQTLPRSARHSLVAWGVAVEVDVSAVARCLVECGAAVREQPMLHDPPADQLPVEVSHALGPTRALDVETWSRLRALDRYVLAQLASRGRLERLATAHDEIMAAVVGGAARTPLPEK